MVVVAARGLGLGIQHVMALGDCYDLISTLEEIIITIIATAVMIPIVGITTPGKSAYFFLAIDLLIE